MNTIKNILLGIALFLGLHGVSAQNENPVISAIQKEVDRNRTELKMEGMALPFFISYSVVETYSYSLSASLGTINSFSESHYRRGFPRVLVGDYHRNTANVASNRMFPPALISLTDNATGIPITIWKGLDDIYKDAAERYKAKMATLQQITQTEDEKKLPDFEQMQPVNMVLQPVPVKFDKPYWENYLRKASETAKQYPDILSSNVSISVQNAMVYTYNTEGSRYATPTTYYVLQFYANVRADDGQDLSRRSSEESVTFEQLPDLTTFSNQCKTMMEELLKLKNAPVIEESYSGPVLFEDLAVERVFRMAFFENNKLSVAPKTIGQSNPMMGSSGPQGGNDFELMLNKKVISRDITVKSITGQEFYKGQRLDGYYPVDAEGVVPDKELTLIENGVLRDMLNGRRPTKKFQHSNGHSRLHLGTNVLQVVPGNILITSNQTFSKEELRKKLLAAAKEEDLEYAYIVRRYDRMYDFSLIYRVYVADGREELVRGAILSDAANLKNFKRILGSSDKEQIRTINDAQSTIICPDALLFEEMDIIRRSNIEFKKPYIVPKPN